MLELLDHFLFRDAQVVDVTKALNPNNPRDYITITRRLANAVKGKAGPEEARALRRALDKLDVNWPDLSDTARERVLQAARAALQPPPQLATQLTDLLATQGQKIGATSMDTAISRSRFRGALKPTADDRAFFQHIADSNSHYIRNEFGARADALSETARKIVSSGIEEALPRAEIVGNLQEAMTAQQVARSDSYYEMVTNTFVGRTRAYANLTAFERAGIDRYQFEAVLDETTSEICRFMHGKVFEVASAKSTFQRVAQAVQSDPEAVMDLQPWASVGRRDDGTSYLYTKTRAGKETRIADISDSAMGQADERGTFTRVMGDAALRRMGITTPPLHGNCRSTIVAI